MGLGQQRIAGKLFAYHSYASIGATSDIKFALDIGNFSCCIYEWEAITDVPHLKIEFFEGQSYSGGTTATLFNQNRSADNVPPLDVVEGVTATPVGDSIMTRGIFSKQEGEHHDFVYEFDKLIFLPNTTYVIKASNLGAQAGEVYFSALFLKHKSL